MGATNPTNGLPYPLDTDPPDVPADIQALVAALAAAGIPARVAAGTATINIAGSASGSVNVTFPVGRFTAAPFGFAVNAGGTGANVQFYVVLQAPPTTSGMNVQAYHRAGSPTTATITVHWFAVQLAL